MGVEYSAAFLQSHGDVAPINNPALLCPEDNSEKSTIGFDRSYATNGWEFWSDPTSNYGAINTLNSRSLEDLKSNTVVLMESHHSSTNVKHQGISWLSAIQNNGDYDKIFSYHYRSKYNFLYEDGHISTNNKSDLMLDNKELMRATDP